MRNSKSSEPPVSIKLQILASITGMYQSGFSVFSLHIYNIALCTGPKGFYFDLQEQCLQEIQTLGDRRERLS
jgi:hypothetical protein